MRRAQTIVWLLLSLWAMVAMGDDLRVSIEPQFNVQPVTFDALTNQTAAGQTISFTRLDFLVSNIALRQTNGAWWSPTNWFAFVNARAGRTNFIVSDVPTNKFDRIRFQIGLSPKMNHGDIAQWPAGHSLNPQVNELYWGWQGGFVFLALEGHWLKRDGAAGGFSFHLANDPQLMTVELPIQLSGNRTEELNLALALDTLFSPTNLLTDQNSSTHSRSNDSTARLLANLVQKAFAVQAPSAFSESATLATTQPVETFFMATNAQPYPFTMSAFFPQPNLPRDNPLTEQGVALGKKLFFDRQLSGDNTQSCASCHQPERAFTDGKAVSPFAAQSSPAHRNAMPLFNLAWKTTFFWDGRAESLRAQVLQPIQNPLEMNAELPVVVKRLQADARYPELFATAFGTREISPERLARALEQFLDSLVSYDSKFDRVINGRDTFTASEQRGFELFNTEYDPARQQFGADCFHCHGGPLFQSQSFANNGLDETFADAGRSLVTHRAGDAGKFAVPSLRNVALTAPYMHDGRFKTLEEAVAHYVTGMKRSATLDPNLSKHPNGGVPLTPEDQAALVAFLKTLTDPSFSSSPSTIRSRQITSL